MQTVASNRFFLTGHSPFRGLAELQITSSYSGFYQQTALGLLKKSYTDQSFRQLCNELIKLAEFALTIRRSDVAEEASDLLLNLSLRGEYQSVGKYYKALCIKRQGNFELARSMFQSLVESAVTPLEYKARALQSIGATYYERELLDEALRFYTEAAQAVIKGQDFLTTVMSNSMISALKSKNGDHQQALIDLENLTPLIGLVAQQHPFIYFDYANSLAVELGEVGRVEEARNASRIALASPYAKAYPEWRETGEELAMRGRRPSRSVVAFSRKIEEAGNVIALLPSGHIKAGQIGEPARILSFTRGKKMPEKETPHKDTQELTFEEKQKKAIMMILDNEKENVLDEVIDALEQAGAVEKEI